MDFRDDKLKNILRRSTIEQPSSNFTDVLLQHLQKTQVISDVKEIKSKHWFIIIPTLFIFLVGIAIGTFWLVGADMENLFSFGFSIVSVSFSTIINAFKCMGEVFGVARYAVFAGLLAFLLLTVDLLIRRRLFNKHQLQ
ncbi:MAG: hypothetical protein LBL90_02215 [Prevotellaceae bacterium]|nr:hypothetical protein [Prevotellaceae bacterium]